MWKVWYINMKLQDPSSCPLCACCYFVKIPPGWFPGLEITFSRCYLSLKETSLISNAAFLTEKKLPCWHLDWKTCYHRYQFFSIVCPILLSATIIRWGDLTTCTSSTSILICVPIIRTLQNTYPECAARRVWLVLLSQVLQAYSVCCKYHH